LQQHKTISFALHKLLWWTTMQINLSNEKPKRIIRIAETVKQTGVPKSSIYALLKENKFPKPVHLSRRCVGFVEAEIQDWIQDRIQARNVA
jgi:prophage regulatory protein